MSSHRAGALVLVAACLACGVGMVGSSSEQATSIRTIVQSLTSTAQVTRVTVSISPVNMSQDLTYDAASGNFTGSFSVPAGTLTITAKAYDAGGNVVGTGTATVDVAPGGSATAVITILDSTGPSGVPDHSPVITSFAVGTTSAIVGQQVNVTASAIDADNNPLSYSWTATPSGCGTFANASVASTTWTAVLAGTCTVGVTATANGKTDSKSVGIAVQATGTVTINGTFVPNPRITSIELWQGGTRVWSVNRSSSDATDHTPVHASLPYLIVIAYDTLPAGSSVTLTDSCPGSTITQPAPITGNSLSSNATWNPTASTGACILTAGATRNVSGSILTDSFPVVLVMSP